MKYRVVQSPKITGFFWPLCQTAGHPVSWVTNSQAFGFLHFWQSGLLPMCWDSQGSLIAISYRKTWNMFGRRRENILRSLSEWRNLKSRKVWTGERHSPLKKIWGSQRPWASTCPPPPFQGSQLPADLASTEVTSREPQLHPPQEFSSEHILSLEGDLRNK